MATVRDARGETYDVDARWRPGHRPSGAGAWEVQVRTADGQVVHRERLATSRAARRRADDLARSIPWQGWVPPVPGAHRLTRDPVAMGDDATDNTRFAPLGAQARLGDLVAWIEHEGAWVSVGERSTWLLALGAQPEPRRPLVVFDQLTGRPPAPRGVVSHLIESADLPLPVDSELHLFYLLRQDIDATLRHVREHPQGPYRLQQDSARG
jgi:hypothetical protein